MTNLTTDSPLSRRIVRSFLHFLNSVEPSAGVDNDALDVAKECLAEVFKIDPSSLNNQVHCDSLVDVFSCREPEGVSEPLSSLGRNAEVLEDQARTREPHFPGRDELFGHFFGSLEKMHHFRRMIDGSDDQTQLDRATNLFHNAMEEMQEAGCQTFDKKVLAETFKSQGNKAMQSKLYTDAIELYTFAIALCADNAVYFCNRAAAFTQIQRYSEAVQDCVQSTVIDPSYSKAYSRLGFAYYSLGMYRDAINKGYLKALELDPNNNSVKENIRVAEQKLREEHQRAGPGQSSRTSSTPQSRPFNIHGVPTDFDSFMNVVAGNASLAEIHTTALTNVMEHFHNRSEGEREPGAAPDEPEIRIGGNISSNVNDLPQELSGAFQSMMGMFSGASPPPPPPHGNQHNENNGGSARS